MVCGFVVGGRGGKGGGPALEMDVGRSLRSLSFSRTSSNSSLVDSPPAQGTSVFCAPDVIANDEAPSSNDEAGGARASGSATCVFLWSRAPAASPPWVTSTPSTRAWSTGPPRRHRRAASPVEGAVADAAPRPLVVHLHPELRRLQPRLEPLQFIPRAGALGEELGAVGRVAPALRVTLGAPLRVAAMVARACARRGATRSHRDAIDATPPRRASLSKKQGRRSRTARNGWLSPLKAPRPRQRPRPWPSTPFGRPARAPASSSPRRARPASTAPTRPPRRTAGPYHRRSPGPALLTFPARRGSLLELRRRSRRCAAEAAPSNILRQYHTTTGRRRHDDFFRPY